MDWGSVNAWFCTNFSFTAEAPALKEALLRIKDFIFHCQPKEAMLKSILSYHKSMEKLKEALDTLKEKLVIVLILVFPDWSKIFHVHVDASSIVLGEIFAQPGEGNIDDLVYFVN